MTKGLLLFNQKEVIGDLHEKKFSKLYYNYWMNHKKF